MFIEYHRTLRKYKWIETWYLIIVYGIPESAKYCSAFLFHTCNIVNKIKHLTYHFVFINYSISKEVIAKERKETKNKKINHLMLKNKGIRHHPSYFKGWFGFIPTIEWTNTICFTSAALAVSYNSYSSEKQKTIVNRIQLSENEKSKNSTSIYLVFCPI